jgi:membrane-associated phospholipid phosphatase
MGVQRIGLTLVVSASLVLSAARPAHTQPAGGDCQDGTPAKEKPALRLSLVGDGGAAIAATALLATSFAFSRESSGPWRRQLLPFDDRLEGRYSSRAASISDMLLAVDVSAPVALFVGTGLDRETGKRTLIYAEALLVNLGMNAVVKGLVARPRPYTYSDDPNVVAFAASQGKDAHASFYSDHSSTTFAASVTGALLFAQTTDDINARAAVWAVELALASATADLRTRAGMHFYSDVLVGAAVGSAIGVAITWLHSGHMPRLSGREWLAIALAPVAGVALGEALPASK